MLTTYKSKAFGVVILLVLAAGLGLWLLSYGEHQDIAGSEVAQTTGPTETPFAYPPPLATEAATRIAITDSLQVLADDYAQYMIDAGRATGPITVVAVADVFPSDSATVQVHSDILADGDSPDAAFVLQGEFYVSNYTYSSHFYLMDRRNGQISREFSNNLRTMLDRMP